MPPFKSSSLIRPLVRRLHPYVPGEQPKIRGLVKLNTNENPYPPSPKVLAAIKAAVDGRLRLYPNPAAEPLRRKLARFHRCAPENIIVGNGSDELLALATRAFVEPGGTVQYFHPSYSLYPVLAAIHGARARPVPLTGQFALPSLPELTKNSLWDFHAPLTFLTTPNAPSGHGCSTSELKILCRAQKGVVVLDEAYVDFAAENALPLALQYPNVLVARTFSKAYALCFLRVGYFLGPVALIDALHKIRDSYNVNGLAQIAAAATLDDLPYYRRNFRRVIATRQHLSRDLAALGFEVLPSQSNFIFVRPPQFPAAQWLEKLRRHRVLVRWFNSPETRDYLRITIGTDSQAAVLLRAARAICHSHTIRRNSP
jgi:histidinol-phosphate aminotransferase